MKLKSVFAGVATGIGGFFSGALTGAVKPVAKIWGPFVAVAAVLSPTIVGSVAVLLVGVVLTPFVAAAGAIVGASQGLVEGARRGYNRFEKGDGGSILKCAKDYAIARGAQNLNFKDDQPGLLDLLQEKTAPIDQNSSQKNTQQSAPLHGISSKRPLPTIPRGEDPYYQQESTTHSASSQDRNSGPK